MSAALIGGLISSTMLTLVVVPVIYSLLESLKEKVYRRRREKAVSAENSARG
ncbi:MAG: hypothetical protein ACOY40_11425 [Bacillota bacterium]